ncbi:hypothetical protein SAMN02745671_02190 [Anaerovibrio lipolyticus DSM 3074]|uniref:Autotransporter domain-containing protein n=2 Tax=Anaerovibrio lipolyticus TaxID=82374 RepID=A0A0B2JX50_9FIRM|nr:autotransporter outer membrane beta-barrel domain-containing protein [Anaerovibrio lipolyticus]KHM52184.1 hypothetical protein NZ47_06295 [Anaerovibrio lipolyticus]SHI94540.1 hypothetical protein SAMN02745671_02190 [Anaerovibrio lipolyticus DSM 3074]
METRKYSSPLGGDISLNKDTKGRGWKGLKGQMALALAVSLWMATGGVAWADEHETVSADKTVNTNESEKNYSLDGNSGADKGEGITFTVESGGKVKTIKGNDVYVTSSGNTVTVKSGGEVNAGSTGSDAIIGGISNNEVTVEGTVTGRVYGGQNTGGVSTNNHVVVTGTVSGAVIGGDGATATNNTVEVIGGHVGGVWGGDGDNTTNNNTVILKNATVDGNVYGGFKELDVTGNTLIVSGINTVGGYVERLKTIKLASDLAWDSTNAVLTAARYYKGSLESSIAIDISEASALKNRTESGTMTLIKSNGSLANFSLSGTAITTGGVTVQSTAKSSEANGVTIGYNNTHTVNYDATNKAINYTVANMVTGVTLGTMTFGTPRALTAGDFDFTGVTNANINTTNFKFNNPESATGTTTLLTNATNLVAGTNIAHTQNFTKAVNGATLSATLSGKVIRTTAGQIGYTAIGTALTGVNLAGWNGTASSVPAGWTSGLTANSITAAGFTAPTIDAGTSTNIFTTDTGSFFKDNQITGAMKYAEQAASSDTVNGVTLTGAESKGVKASDDGKSLIYARSNFNVNSISLGNMTWGTARTASGTGYDYTNAVIDASSLSFTNPESITPGTTTLLTANNTLADVAETTKNVSYGFSPVDGVTVNGRINGSYKTESNAITYTATANNATKLTFGNVAWKDTGALMTRPSNITFNGAAVDTSNINFTNIKELEANKTMTLVSNFGDTVGTITGTKYKVGSTLQGEGKASLEGSNLIFTTDTRAEKMTVQEQTHNTVMGAEVGMAALSAGNDFVGAATEGLAMAGNTGTDGMATYANMGGGSMNVETGSHVKTHTWNAILALGHKNEKKLSTTEYGAFFEYGTGNYSTFNGDERGDGSTRYTGGGILGKWQKNNGFYVEGSLRAGSIHDDANNVLRDANGNPYSYTTDATYWGAHIGVGREIKLNKTDILDLYAKYFYNHRGSVSFDAGGHYDLGAVESSVLRVGTRYTVKQNDNINYYGGLAVEHEFCGRASGFADGVAIRGADISGTSVRGEIGAKFKPDEKSNVTLDLNLSGFAGKKQGLTGGLSAVFHF